MSTERQQDQASLYVLGALPPAERAAFEAELLADESLRQLVRELQRGVEGVASAVSSPPPGGLKDKVLRRVDEKIGADRAAAVAGFRFLGAAAESGWKPLPVPGTFIKLLSLEKERGYAVLLGRIDAGVRYPAHVNAGPEDFYILSGDLVVGDRHLRAGDFHHADAGSHHGENYSTEGCTLLAVLTTDDPLVQFAARE